MEITRPQIRRTPEASIPGLAGVQYIRAASLDDDYYMRGLCNIPLSSASPGTEIPVVNATLSIATNYANGGNKYVTTLKFTTSQKIKYPLEPIAFLAIGQYTKTEVIANRTVHFAPVTIIGDRTAPYPVVELTASTPKPSDPTVWEYEVVWTTALPPLTMEDVTIYNT